MVDYGVPSLLGGCWIINDRVIANLLPANLLKQSDEVVASHLLAGSNEAISSRVSKELINY